MSFDKESIVAALERRDQSDRQRRAFGAIGHHYRLHPPLPLAVVESFEQQHGISLPEDYRSFIASIGNGGAGPSYGVIALGEHDDGRWEDGYLVGDPSKPFAYQDAWNLPESFWSREPNPPEGISLEEEDRMMEAWDKELEAHYWNPALMDGAIPICHRGCALRQWLVVTGPQRGYVWNDDRADYGGVYPLLDASGKRMTFTDWYLAWLEASEQVVSCRSGELDGATWFRFSSDWIYLAALVVGLIPGIVFAAWWDWPILICGLASALATVALVRCIVVVMRSSKRQS